MAARAALVADRRTSTPGERRAAGCGTRRAALALLVAAALLLGAQSVADAHTALVRAEPAAGSRLAASPERVRLVFNEPIEPTLARVTIALGSAVTRLDVVGDPRDVHALTATVGTLAPGAYRLVWRVVSADGHAVEGAYGFVVGTSTAADPFVPDVRAEEAGPAAWGPAAVGAPLVPALLRGLALGSLMALAGLLLFLALPRATDAPAPRRPMRLALALAVATPVLLGLHAAAWLMNASPEHRLTGDWTSSVLRSELGRLELWRTGLALLALWALGLARRPGLALLFALGSLVVSGATGHPAAIGSRWTIPGKIVHLVAAAAWVGGLLWLILRERSDRAALLRETSRVSSIALTAVLLVTLSGALQTLMFLPSTLDLVRSAYGAVTLAKVAGLLALVAFGAYHRFRVMPRLAPGVADSDEGVALRFATSLRREAAVMGLVILLGGLLAYVPPPAPADGLAASNILPSP